MDGEETEASQPDNESLFSDSGASVQPHEKVRTFPTTPGVYLMKDAQGRVIYVGKAVNLRSRAGSYFTKAAEVELRTAKLIPEIADIDYIDADSEVDALLIRSTTHQGHSASLQCATQRRQDVSLSADHNPRRFSSR